MGAVPAGWGLSFPQSAKYLLDLLTPWQPQQQMHLTLPLEIVLLRSGTSQKMSQNVAA